MAQEIADSKLIDTWSSDGLKVKPDISKIIEGWQLGEQPPHEYMNWLQNTFGSKLNHILKNGVALWNNETPYLAGSSVQHNENIWLCKVDNTNSEPTDSNNNWSKMPSFENLALTVYTINDFPISGTTGDVVIVKDLDRGGIFIYDSTKVDEDNQGTNFNGWIRQFSGAVNVKWFGAKGDGINDDTTAIQTALDSAKNVFISAGNYKITSQLTINSYNVVTGEGFESYGESDITDKTDITVLKLVGFSAGQYGINISGSRAQIGNLSIEGDYVGNGITIANLRRELILDRVSVKYVQKGIYSTSCHVANFQNVTVTAQDVGIEWGSGTTLNFINTGIQGDPRAGRMNTGLKFNGSLANAKMSGGFVQHMITAVEVSGQNVIEFDSWDFEDLVNDTTGTIFKLGTCNNGTLSINNCNGVAGTSPEGQSVFRIVGAIGNYFPIDIGTFYHFVTASGKLINFDGGSLSSKFRMMSYYYAKHSPQFGASVNPQSHIVITDRTVYDNQSYTYTTSLTNTAIPLKNADGTDYDFDKGAIVNVTIYGTSTDNTSCTYAVGRDGDSLYKLTYLAGNSTASSNRPYMVLSGGLPYLKTNNPTAYPARVSVHGI